MSKILFSSLPLTDTIVNNVRRRTKSQHCRSPQMESICVGKSPHPQHICNRHYVTDYCYKTNLIDS